MGSPDDRERRGEDEKGLSNLAEAYQKAAPYIGASTSLVASVGLFAWAGWWLDQKLGHEKPWFLLAGAGLGMVAGFVSFFRTVLGKRRQ